ncbi:MAG TPA: hypothetical protein VFB45_26690 [Pseudolabrys sp.]|nr:hypothetical protein [Pseudolabrys sp.]
MSDTGSSKAAAPQGRRIALIGAIATTLGLVNLMSNGSEAPSPAVLMLEYLALGLGVFALIGGLIMLALRK